MDDLKQAICVKFIHNDRAMLERVGAKFQERFQKFIDVNEHQMMDIDFHAWFWQTLIEYKHVDVIKLLKT